MARLVHIPVVPRDPTLAAAGAGRVPALSASASLHRILAVCVVGLLGATSVAAAEVNPNPFRGAAGEPADAQPSDIRRGDAAHPDISGIWAPISGGIAAAEAARPPLTPAYRSRFAAGRRRAARGSAGDPVDRCVALGAQFLDHPFELVQLPALAVLVSTSFWNPRHIYYDGAGHSPDREPSFNGDSIARWEGDVFVVETNNMRAGLLAHGVPYSDKLVMTERFRRTAANELHVDVTLTDPQAFTRPLSYAWTYRLQPPATRLAENFCDSASRPVATRAGS